jgi:hypothetical protein
MRNDEERRELASAVEQALKLGGSYLRDALKIVEECLQEAPVVEPAMTDHDIAKLLLRRAELKAAISPRGAGGAGFGQ